MDNPSGKPLVDVSIDDISQSGSLGTIANAITNNIYGFNHRQTPSPIPINKDHYGLTFFTRPQLNLTSSNLRNVRLMIPLLATESKSYQRAIRCLLDPRLATDYSSDLETGANNEITSPLIDEKQAFIPILTNHLNSISGWPDITVPTFTSKEGQYKEGYSMVDGVTVNYSTYDITATFRNSVGDPITTMFYYWTHYMANVFEGKLMPYPDMIVENEIDYNTRIYRLILDPTKRYVQRIGACGASFPIAVPVGGLYDFSNEKPYNDANSEIAIPFRCMGAMYNDDILIFSFNKTVSIFNAEMSDENRDRFMMPVPQNELYLFNNRGYPYINPKTYELQWWISKDYYQNKKEAFEVFKETLGMIVN